MAVACCVRVRGVIMNLHKIADLSAMEWNIGPVGAPTLTVVVPAKDEAANIAATCEALLMADYPRLKIVCVDDRSTDATGTILDEIAAQAAGKIDVIHITELPEGWLGKTFALEEATRLSESDWLLYTDADVLFSPSILRRALAYAEATCADHLVVMPTAQVRSRGEGMMLGFLPISLGLAVVAFFFALIGSSFYYSFALLQILANHIHQRVRRRRIFRNLPYHHAAILFAEKRLLCRRCLAGVVNHRRAVRHSTGPHATRSDTRPVHPSNARTCARCSMQTEECRARSSRATPS